MPQRQQTFNSKMHRTTITMPEDLWQKVKVYAEEENYSISLALSEIVKDFFRERQKNAKK